MVTMLDITSTQHEDIPVFNRGSAQNTQALKIIMGPQYKNLSFNVLYMTCAAKIHLQIGLKLVRTCDKRTKIGSDLISKDYNWFGLVIAWFYDQLKLVSMFFVSVYMAYTWSYIQMHQYNFYSALQTSLVVTKIRPSTGDMTKTAEESMPICMYHGQFLVNSCTDQNGVGLKDLSTLKLALANALPNHSQTSNLGQAVHRRMKSSQRAQIGLILQRHSSD